MNVAARSFVIFFVDVAASIGDCFRLAQQSPVSLPSSFAEAHRRSFRTLCIGPPKLPKVSGNRNELCLSTCEQLSIPRDPTSGTTVLVPECFAVAKIEL
jgi:hypothetical protein